MTKKVLAFLLTIGVIASLLAPAAFATGPAITASAQIDNKTREVKISGQISSGAGQQVTVKVQGPQNEQLYVNQTTSLANGSYQFVYTLSSTAREGQYGVVVGGSGISKEEQAVTSFTYTAGTTTPPVSSGGGGGTTPEPGVVNLTKDDLKGNPSAGKVSITIPQGTIGGSNGSAKVVLPANTADIIGDNSLELKSDKLTIVIPHSVLVILQGAVPADVQATSEISLTVSTLPKQQSDSLLEKAASGDKSGLNAAGSVYEFKLTVKMPNGEEKTITSFEEPLEIAFAIDADADQALLGVYFIANDGTLEYIGGKIQNGQMLAKISHFSIYAVLEYKKSFTDVTAGFWAARDIQVMAAKHIVYGKTESTFDPKGQVTRAEFAAFLVRALELKASGVAKSPFADVASDKWYAGAVAAAYEAKLISGKDAAHFKPEGLITREEMAVMIARALEKQAKATTVADGLLNKFGDRGNVSKWALEAMQISLQANILLGNADSKLLPAANASRAESAAVIRRMLDYAGSTK
ncbi:S-layer homology domain-containing protein [Cohnella faecalis]|uniref:SLH domain-containing protein n=1 Tax=Cohnella faecalis TaxID=2315694 RepID=A0A398CJE7_9BACL|nr:S-layer homology domain-containing protein [Cohnella faecalis]RIE00958.1 hypothetical protein D3H35_25700 [Cohnella faecalis]